MSLLWTTAVSYYHGTAADLSPGDRIRPASEVGVQSHSHPDIDPGEHGNSDYVYFSDRPERAHQYAHDSVWLKRGEHPRVYEVQPDEGHEEDPENSYTGESGDYRAPGATVVREWHP
jgi:hypothetical protein